jgi:hypothetical protein
VADGILSGPPDLERRRPRPPAAAAPVPPAAGSARRLTASGSIAVPGARARVARASRILVEGAHDAELLERVWGDDLRIEGIVVLPIGGVDNLAAEVAEFRPGPGRRLGVLVDHLVPGSKEARVAKGVEGPDVLVVGHPFVDVWAAIRPRAAGIASWPDVPRGVDWKTGVCQALGVRDPRRFWPELLGRVRTYADLDPALVGPVEQLVDFLTEHDEHA